MPYVFASEVRQCSGVCSNSNGVKTSFDAFAGNANLKSYMKDVDMKRLKGEVRDYETAVSSGQHFLGTYVGMGSDRT